MSMWRSPRSEPHLVRCISASGARIRGGRGFCFSNVPALSAASGEFGLAPAFAAERLPGVAPTRRKRQACDPAASRHLPCASPNGANRNHRAPMARWLAGLVAAAIAVGLSLGCDFDRKPEAVDRSELARARSFVDFRLYYLGRSFRGEPLTDVLLRRSPRIVTFSYGECEPVGGEGACAYRISISVSSICERHPGLLGISAARLQSFRGAPGGDHGNGLEIYTGDTTVLIFNPRQPGRRIVAGLRSLDGRVMPSEKLPAPVEGAVFGRPKGCRSTTRPTPGRVR